MREEKIKGMYAHAVFHMMLFFQECSMTRTE